MLRREGPALFYQPLFPPEMCFKDCLAKQELNPKVPMHLPPVIPLSVISSLL